MQFVALPFNLSSAPLVVTKVLAPLLALLLNQGHPCHRLPGQSLAEGLLSQDIVCQRPKKHPVPSNLWLDNFFSNVCPTAALSAIPGSTLEHSPCQNIASLKSSSQTLWSQQCPLFCFCLGILDPMVSSLKAVPFAQFYDRPHQSNIPQDVEQANSMLGSPNATV